MVLIITVLSMKSAKWSHKFGVMLIRVKKKCSLSVNESYKYFIGCKDDYYETKLLSIILLRASAYVKSYDDETKWVHLLIEDGDLLQKYKKSLG